MADIDSLSIQINSSADQADDAIERLAQRLERLRNGTRDMRSLNVAARGIANMATAANSLSPDSGDSITRLANGLMAMQPVADMRISSSIGSQISAIGTAAAGLNGIDWSGVTNLASNLAPLQHVQRATDLNSIANTLRKIPQAIQTINQIDPTRMSEFAEQINKLTGYMHPLADEMRAVSAGFSALPTNIRKAIEANQKLTQSTQATTKSFEQLASRVVNIGALYYGMRRIASASMSAFQASNDYVEALNLAQVAMGSASEEAIRYAEQVEQIAGINMTSWISQIGSFNQVITGLGVASDSAANMSQQLVQLGYDIQSAFNVNDIDQVMTSLQSGITGQIKAMRQYGVELSVAAMKSYALELGITKQWKNMTAAEKVALRYNKIMHDTVNIQGDLARTIATPANSLRILSIQWEVAKRSMGQFVSVIAVQVIPWVQAAIKIINMLASELASAFGYALPEIDYSGTVGGFEDIADSIDNVADSADSSSKKLKNLLADFDELNVIQSESGSGGGKGGAGSVLDDFGSIGDLYNLGGYTYDFLAGIDRQADDIVNKIIGFWNRFKPEILGLLAAIVSYKLVNKAAQLFETLSKISKMPLANVAGGISLAVAGIAISYDGIQDLVLNGFTWESMSKAIIGYVAEGLGGTIIASAAGVSGIAAWGVGFSLALSATGVEIGIANIESAAVNGYTESTFLTAIGSGIITGLGIAGATAAAGVAGGVSIALGAVVGFTASAAYITLAGVKDAEMRGYDEENSFLRAVGDGIVTGLGFAGALAAVGTSGIIALTLGAVVGLVAGIAYIELVKDAGYKYLAEQAFKQSGEAENGFSVDEMLSALQKEMDTRVEGAKLSASVYADVGTYASKVSSLATSITKLNNAAFGHGKPTAEQITELKEAWAEFDLSYSKMNTTVSDTIFAGLNTVIDSEIETLRGKASEFRTIMISMTKDVSEAEAHNIQTRTEVLDAMAKGIASPEQLEWYQKYASVMAMTDEELRNQANWESMFDENGMLTKQIDYSSLDELKKFFGDVATSYNVFNESMLKGIDAQEKAVVDAKTSLMRELKIGSITQDQYDTYTSNLDAWLTTYKQAVSSDMDKVKGEMDTVFASVISQVMMGMNGKDSNLADEYVDEYIGPLFNGIEKAYRDAGLDDKANAISEYWDLFANSFPFYDWDANNGAMNISTFMQELTVSADDAKFYDNAYAINELTIAVAEISKVIAETHPTLDAADVEPFVTSMNDAIEAANRAAEAIQGIGGLFGFTVGTYTPIQKVQLSTQEGYATGGFPQAGELFIGNENGIEMMGQMGNRNVVANNEQIVEGIREGVSDANSGVESLLETLIDVVRGQGNSNSSYGTVRPSAEFGRFVRQSLELYADVTG